MKRLLAAVCFLLASAPAEAQQREWLIEEMAADLAYGFCPLYLAGQFSLTAPELAERGFGATVSRQPHPRVGDLETVSARHKDGEVVFGGAPGKACTVMVSGPKRPETLAKLRSSMAFMGLDFQPAPSPGPAVAGVTAESFRAPVDGQMLYVQLVQTDVPVPTVAAQLFAMEK
ncbi:MAG TPA: hypothetical protein VIT45_16540 [Allosphingosinicella sp.]